MNGSNGRVSAGGETPGPEPRQVLDFVVPSRLGLHGHELRHGLPVREDDDPFAIPRGFEIALQP